MYVVRQSNLSNIWCYVLILPVMYYEYTIKCDVITLRILSQIVGTVNCLNMQDFPFVYIIWHCFCLLNACQNVVTGI